MNFEIPAFLNYHRSLADILEAEESAIWDWFTSDKLAEQAFDENRLSLLKNAVRLDAEHHDALFTAAKDVAHQLEIDAPISLYQGTNSNRNAALYYTPNEINIMFEGDILDILSDTETRCLLGHEMAHYLHKTREGERYFTTDRMLGWICGESGAHQAHARSLWLSQLYQEIFADRVGLAVCKDRDAAISVLIKASTGLKKFSVDTYLDQAREALSLNKSEGSKGYSHPEAYIRAIALDAWATDPAEADQSLAKLVEGDAVVERLDMLAQRDLTKLTRAVVDEFLTADWATSDDVIAHAQAYFPDFQEGSAQTDETLAPLRDASDDVKDYISSVLLDFAAVDPDLEDVPVQSALVFAQTWDLTEQIEKRIVKDLGVAKKKLPALRPATAEDRS